ncbi:MAG: DUF4363 family protein [Clostridia bacterium]|nr:DUF4363 family protein [Clostridia bacterium]
MNAKLFLGAAFLALIILLGALSLAYTSRVCKDIEKALLKDDIESAEMIWIKHRNTLAMFYPHSKTDELSRSFIKARMSLSCGDGQDYESEKELLLFGLYALKEYDVPTLRSIF